MNPNDPTGTTSQTTRTDIQVLRGLAVLIVVLYHAKLSVLPAGYLGVDVFFVISGFLITRLIKTAIEQNRFTFSGFYFRRAKRLLPAAYVTLLVTALLAPVFLTDAEMKDFRAQMIGAVTFTANMVLWRQSGYFEGAAELKPLLHVWSLAIEEQYYFILPAMLAFVPRRLWMATTLVALLASGALCALLADRPAAQFFLLPTRAWELCIGSVGALLVLDARATRWLKLAFWPALVLLLLLPCFKLGKHPGLQALAICLATFVVILRNHPILSTAPGMRGMAKVGDMSYSLYLVHWPIFAFFNNAWIGETARDQPTWMQLGLVALSFALSYLLHRYIEEPIRHANIQKSARVLVRAIATSLGLVLVTAGIAHAFTQSKDYAQIKRVNHGFSPQCEFQSDFQPLAVCRNSEQPEVLVWGDSFAMHLVPGVASRMGTLQATRSVCAPLRGMALVLNQVDESWAQRCIQFNESVIAYLKDAPSIKTVVLSSPFDHQVSDEQFLLKRDLKTDAYQRVSAGIAPAVEGIRSTAEAVRAMGKRVVVIAPPPSTGFDIGRCIERLDRQLLSLKAPPQCQIREQIYRQERQQVLQFLAQLPAAGVEVISFDPYLCKSGQCLTQVDGTLIYRDTGHLSHEGSVFLAKAMALDDRIRKAAR